MARRFDDPGTQDFGASGPAQFDQEGPIALEPRQGHGCWFYGCITALGLLGLTVLGVYLGYRYVAGKIRQEVETYTDAAPKPLPVVEVPEDRRREILQRAEDFERAVTTFPEAKDARFLTDEQRTLVLTEDELNVLLEQTPDLKGKFHVTIADDQIQAQVSLPLNDLPGLRGRYFNGEAHVFVWVDGGRPVVQFRNTRINGNRLAKPVRALIERLNLASGESDGAPPKPLAHPLEKIEVKDDTLIIVARKEPELQIFPTLRGGVVAWKTEEGGNGHFYELVRLPKCWIEANEEAQERTYKGRKGHLATITSAAENAFLRDRVAINELAWIGLTDAPNFGGEESLGRPDPKHDGWVWVTGEAVTFVAWSQGEPSNGGSRGVENFGEFNGLFGTHRGEWDDLEEDAGGGRFFLVEFEPEGPEEPER